MLARVLVPASVVIAFSAAAASAFSQTATSNVAIGAVVPKYCAVGGKIGAIEVPVTIAVSPSGTIDIASRSFTVPSVICNAAANVIVTSVRGGAKSTSASALSGASANAVDYLSTVSFGGASLTLNTAVIATATTAQRDGTVSTSAAAIGNVVITITPVLPNDPLARATTYSDTLRVWLAPR